MKIEVRTWFFDRHLENLPCFREHALGEHESPPCLPCSKDIPLIRQDICPTYAKMKDQIERVKTEAYKSGYGFVAFVVLKGPVCGLVAFRSCLDEDYIRTEYGDDLIVVVPV
jgi:hypothetical protein